MPLYIDIHHVPGVTSAAAAAEHVRDLELQGPFEVNYSKYFLNETSGKSFCLCEAPNIEAAIAVHRAAHGEVAERIIEITPELSDLFLGPCVTDPAGAVRLPEQYGGREDPGTRTVLFTDIVGSTAITQRLGDEASFRLVSIHDEIVRKAIATAGGREVKHTGDGIMAVFLSTVSALNCAVEIQREFDRHCRECPDLAFQVRIGAATGEPVEHHRDFFGATVQLAARLCASAEPHEIVVSNVVADLCIGKGIRFDEPRTLELKGFDQPVSTRRVHWTAAAI